jgi:hypothetical protein
MRNVRGMTIAYLLRVSVSILRVPHFRWSQMNRSAPSYKALLDNPRNTIVTLRRVPAAARCATVFCTICDYH